jgi:hypothetical protein
LAIRIGYWYYCGLITNTYWLVECGLANLESARRG